MATRFTTTHHAINLLRNGNFELTQSVGTKKVPAFWQIDGAVADEIGNSDSITSFRLDQEQEIAPGGSDNYLTVFIQGSDEVTVSQSFVRSTDIAFDFVAPLASGSRAALAGGYRNSTEQLLPGGLYTFAMSVHVIQGEVELEIVGYGEDGELIILTPLEGSATRTANQDVAFSREVFAFQSDAIIYRIGIRLRRVTGSGLAELQLALATLTTGTYSSLPFLIDPFISSIPAGAVVLSMGTGCPLGFEEIGNADQEPLPEWLASNPNAQGRVGNFPRSAETQTGTELHTAATDFSPLAADTVLFPSSTNKDVVENKDDIDTDYINPPGDAPGGDDGVPSHKHELSSASTRPVSWAFRLCRRL